MFRGTYEKSFYKILHRAVHSEYRFIKYLKQKKLHKLPRVLLHGLRFITLRLKLNRYLSKKKNTGLILRESNAE
jgi:hypothetical protein